MTNDPEGQRDPLPAATFKVSKQECQHGVIFPKHLLLKKLECNDCELFIPAQHIIKLQQKILFGKEVLNGLKFEHFFIEDSNDGEEIF